MHLLSLFPALQVRNYRIFWMTQWIALIGFWLQLTAQQWLVYTMTDSAFLLGLLAACQFAPSLFFTLFTGLWIDKHNKRKILLGTQLFYLLQASLLGLLLWTGHETYGWILFFAFFIGTIDSFDMPARMAFMPELVGKKALHSAISLNSANFNITRMAGPLLAAFLLKYLSYSTIFFMNALSLVPIIIAYSHMDVNSVITTMEERHPLHEIREGLMQAKNNPLIYKNLIAAGIVSGLILNMGTYGPLFADRVLHAGIDGFGSILFAAGAGSMVSGLLAGASRNHLSHGMIFGSAILCGLLLMAVSFVSYFIPALILFGLLGFFVIAFIVNCNTVIQMASPKEFLGRIMGLYTFVFLGSAPFGSLLVSAIIERVGTSLGLLLIGALEIALLLLFARPVKGKEAAIHL